MNYIDHERKTMHNDYLYMAFGEDAQDLLWGYARFLQHLDSALAIVLVGKKIEKGMTKNAIPFYDDTN